MEDTAGSPSSYKFEKSSSYWPTVAENSAVSTSQFIMPYTRINRDYRDRKKLGVYLNDSTHINPSDPNSMRDQG